MRAKGYSNDCQQHEYKKMKSTQAVLPPITALDCIHPSIGFFFFHLDRAGPYGPGHRPLMERVSMMMMFK
jgi:hypothetical protein